MIGQLFHLICYQPLLNLLVFVYNVVPTHDIGLVIIILTVLFKAITYPLTAKTIEAQKALKDLQPKMDEMKERLKDKKEEQAKEMIKLYKEHKINPLSSCLPLLIQIPFLIAIYQVFSVGLSNGNLDALYPVHINTLAFGFLDMAKPQWLLAVLAGAAQFWQTKMMLAKRPEIKVKAAQDEDMAAIMSKQMTYMMPIMTIIIGVNLPSGLVFYWFLLTILTTLQQLIVMKDKKKPEVEIVK